MKKVVGKVTTEEKMAIWAINSHKNSLDELLQILPKDGDLYKEASLDMEETMRKYQEWWNQGYEKYRWEKGDKNWKIVFDTNEIIIDSE